MYLSVKDVGQLDSKLRNQTSSHGSAVMNDLYQMYNQHWCYGNNHHDDRHQYLLVCLRRSPSVWACFPGSWKDHSWRPWLQVTGYQTGTPCFWWQSRHMTIRFSYSLILSCLPYRKRRKTQAKRQMEEKECRAPHLQPTQPPKLIGLDSICSHTDHTLLLDVHHLQDGSTGYYDQLLSQQVTSIAYRAGKTASLWSTQQKKNSKINIQWFQTSRETHQWPQSLWTPPLPPAPHHHLCERNLSMLKKHIWKKCIWSMTKRENVSLFFITLTQSDALPVGLEPLHFQVFFSCRVMNTSAAHWMLQFMARPEMLMVS